MLKGILAVSLSILAIGTAQTYYLVAVSVPAGRPLSAQAMQFRGGDCGGPDDCKDAGNPCSAPPNMQCERGAGPIDCGPDDVPWCSDTREDRTCQVPGALPPCSVIADYKCRGHRQRTGICTDFNECETMDNSNYCMDDVNKHRTRKNCKD